MVVTRRSWPYAILPLATLALAAGCDDAPESTAAPVAVKGELVAVSGGHRLRLWGTHYERGFAHGYLAGGNVLDMLQNLFVDFLFQQNDSLYEYARAFVRDSFVVAPEYREEARGIVDGMVEAGVSIQSPALGRPFDSLDIVLMSSLEELYFLVQMHTGCESFSSWGSSTAADPFLAGETVITRFWDYSRWPELLRNQFMFVHEPAEPDEQRWVSCGFAGAVGTCSGMNAAGLGAFLNYGLVDTVVNPGPYRAVSHALRAAIERRDVNADLASTPQDVVAAMGAYRARFPSIVHVVAPASVSAPLVVECNNHRGLVVRTREHNSLAPPVVPGDNLVAANYFRLLYPVRDCTVYAAVVDSLTVSPAVTIERNARILAAATGYWMGAMYKVQFVPALGLIRWACATATGSAHESPDNEYTLRGQ